MKNKLNFHQYITIASMLFGLFFGAGNLIFPVSMGQMAGYNVWPAIAGFLVTGVGLPLLGVMALGISRQNGLGQMSRRVSRRYGTFFTCALYLTIGPFFAIPRCATVPFSVGIEPLLHNKNGSTVFLALFSFIFFLIVLWFSLRPSGILTWVGKILNPVFLISLGTLMITALIKPLGHIKDITPVTDYESGAFFHGFLEGYNTMDALAGLAFGIIVVNVIRDLGIEKPEDVAKCTIKAGLISTVLMAVIYIIVTIVGTQSRGAFEVSSNGGITLALIADRYYGSAGALILAATVTFACLKTSIGLITSCSETFCTLFPNTLSYKKWAVLFSTVSFCITNLGLSAIINYSLPVLMFLYPLAITLIILNLTSRFFSHDRTVYVCTTLFTLAAALLDFINALPDYLKTAGHFDSVISYAHNYLPFFKLGLGWVCPAAAGFIIGMILHCRHKEIVA